MLKSRWDIHRMAGLGKYFKAYWWERGDNTYSAKIHVYVPEGKTPRGEEKITIWADGFNSWFLAEEWILAQAEYYRRKYGLRGVKR
jgi:hypothetical protein